MKPYFRTKSVKKENVFKSNINKYIFMWFLSPSKHRNVT